MEPKAGNGKAVSIKDVAKKAGVSITTVSLVLRDQPDRLVPIREETKARVRQAAEALNYRPNSLAQRFVTQRSHALGVLIPCDRSSIGDLYFSQTLAGIVAEAAEHEYRVVLLGMSEQFVKQRGPFDLVQKREIDGMLSVAINYSDAGEFASSTPYVSLYRDLPGAPSVGADEASATTQVMERLYQRGHRRIAHLWAQSTAGLARRQAFRRFCTERGLKGSQQLLAQMDLDPEIVRKQVTDLLSASERPTAIYLGRSWIAAMVYEIAAQLNQRIPEDLAVIGSGNVPVAEFLRPPLTYVSKPYYDMGRKAASLVLDRLQAPGRRAQPPTAEEHLLPCELVIGGSD